MPRDLAALVVRHETLNPEHFLLTLDCPAIARHADPGQFVMLQTRQGYEPLLRRPMSICRVLPGKRRIQILYKVVGQGTRYLSRQPPGTLLRTLGPLGRGFVLPPRRRAHSAGGARRPAGDRERAILVAGGVGIAIFPFLVEALGARGQKTQLLFGARSRHDLVMVSWFRSHGVEVRLATEDGSRGVRGYVTRLLEPLLARPGLPPALYVCGPTPMMRAVGGLALAAGVSCQMALESQMPCGIGVCLGCVVRTPDAAGAAPYPRVCTEGPVFEAGRVLL